MRARDAFNSLSSRNSRALFKGPRIADQRARAPHGYPLSFSIFFCCASGARARLLSRQREFCDESRRGISYRMRAMYIARYLNDFARRLCLPIRAVIGWEIVKYIARALHTGSYAYICRGIRVFYDANEYGRGRSLLRCNLRVIKLIIHKGMGVYVIFRFKKVILVFILKM